MNENFVGNEIIRVYFVEDEENEVGVNQSSCVQVEITNTENEDLGLVESEYITLVADNSTTDSSMLDDKMLIDDSNSESQEIHETYENDGKDNTTLEENSGVYDDEIEVSVQNNKPKAPKKKYSDAPLNANNYPGKLYTCDICGYKAKKSHYKRHLGTHIAQDCFRCGVCKKLMESEAELEAHKEKHRCSYDPNIFQCNICPYTSNRFSSVVYHTDVHYKLKKGELTCGLCRFTTTNKIHFRRHMAVHSKQDTKCPICLKEFKSTSLRQRHMQSYKSPDHNEYQCPKCSHSTHRFNHLKQHMIIHRTGSLNQCPHCPFKTKRKPDLGRHILVKHKRDDEVTKFQCDFCSYQTRITKHVTSHMKNMHLEKLITKKCTVCSYKTVSQVLIERHFTIHSKVPDKFFICSLCAFGCESQELLEEHVEVNHDNEEASVEENSSELTELEKVRMEPELGKEIMDEESEEKIDGYSCQFPLCNIVSKTERDVKIHMILCHISKGLGRCPECTFHTKSRLLYMDHLKVHGIDIEEFKAHLCDICGTRWFRKADLTKHMAVHQGSNSEEPKINSVKVQENSKKKMLSCMFCSYKSRMRMHLYKHMIKHGKEHQKNFLSYFKDNDEK